MNNFRAGTFFRDSQNKIKKHILTGKTSLDYDCAETAAEFNLF
jgi:hypothetical protein